MPRGPIGQGRGYEKFMRENLPKIPARLYVEGKCLLINKEDISFDKGEEVERVGRRAVPRTEAAGTITVVFGEASENGNSRGS